MKFYESDQYGQVDPNCVVGKFGQIGKISLIIIVLCAILGASFALCHFSGDVESSGSVCQVCGKTFTDADNMHSITMTNMCKNCYSNYKAGMAVTGKDVDGSPLN